MGHPGARSRSRAATRGEGVLSLHGVSGASRQCLREFNRAAMNVSAQHQSHIAVKACEGIFRGQPTWA